MKRVYIAAALNDERMALHTLLTSLGTEIVGESGGWRSVLALAPRAHPEVMVVSWGLIAARSTAALRELRSVCPNTVVIVTPGETDAHQHLALAPAAVVRDDRKRHAGGEPERRLADRLQVIFARV